MNNIDSVLKNAKKIHFIGIGGSGMCPLAEILHHEGYTLTGSDNNYTDTLQRIMDLGIEVTMGQSAENIKDPDMIVYTAALLPDNPELVAAKASGIPTFERSKLFGAITRLYDNAICVCGTHGKTTVTSMITQILYLSDKDPSAVIGGTLPLIGAHGIVGKSENIVCEACEFVDTFLELSPDVSVILNIDEDHLDYFKTLDNIIKSFRKFAGLTTKKLIVNGDDVNSMKAVEGIDTPIITFGTSDKCDYYATDITMENGAFARYKINHSGKDYGYIQLAVPGIHNVLNSLAAICAGIDAGATVEQCVSALEKFKGAGRRFEILAECNGITIADDYAHHPAELKVTLDATMKMGYKNVWAVFQPFTYSRTSILFDDFVEVLKIPDKVVMTEIMGAREVNTYNIYTSQLSEKIPGSVWFNTFEEIVDYVYDNASDGDLVITLGCGDIYKAAKLLIKKYEDK
ncbi:MAG: UDP-N-acetylmuramate--L-alanine ligase [Clostridia bacterium]|nr:UDP-N-acetylmuramate--L-alanine ligase [Clostridia bacterium]